MKDYLKQLKCLTDETRTRIFKILIHSNSNLCVCEISKILDIPTYNISKHLKELKNNNFLTEKKDGQFVIYQIALRKDKFFKQIINLIAEIEDNQKDFKMLKRVLSENLRKSINLKKE